MEKLDMKKIRCQAKVVGTVVTVAGAMLMTLYKGNVINLVWSEHMHHSQSNSPAQAAGISDKDWVTGSILLIIATLAWASFFILQVKDMMFVFQEGLILNQKKKKKGFKRVDFVASFKTKVKESS